MDAPVGDELLQSYPGHLPADRLEAGHGDSLRRVVDDEVHTGERLNGADVAALPADDAALHLVIGQGNHTDGDFGRMVSGAPLDGGGYDLLGALVGLLLGAGFDLLDLQRRLVSDLALHLGNQVLLGLLHGQARDALEHLGLAALDEVNFLLGLVGGGVLGRQGLFLLLDVFGLAVQVLFLLLQAALLLLQVGPATLLFLLVFGAAAQDFLLGLQQSLPLLAFGALDGFVDNPAGLFLRAGDLLFRYCLPIGDAEKEGNGRHHDRDH